MSHQHRRLMCGIALEFIVLLTTAELAFAQVPYTTTCWIRDRQVADSYCNGESENTTIIVRRRIVVKVHPSAAGSSMNGLQDVDPNLRSKLGAVADTPVTLKYKAEVAMERGDLVAASDFLDAALRLDPSDADIQSDERRLQRAILKEREADTVGTAHQQSSAPPSTNSESNWGNDAAVMKRTLEGMQTAIRKLDRSMSLDASQRNEMMAESEHAAVDMALLGTTGILDVVGAHVSEKQSSADAELKHALDVLTNETDPGRKERLGLAFVALQKRRNELRSLHSSIEEYSHSIEGGRFAHDVVYGDNSRSMEHSLEVIYSGVDQLHLVPPWLAVLKYATDAGYDVITIASNSVRTDALDANAESYLKALKTLKRRMEDAVQQNKLASRQ